MTTTTKQYEVTSWTLSFRDSASNKFYNVHAFADGNLVLNWGRIGTSGQTKIEKYTPDEAQIIAKRQVYAKAGKGYKMQVDEFKYTVDKEVHERVIESNWGCITLDRALQTSLQDSQFTKQQRLVTTHYDTFIEQTNQVLDAAAKGEDFDGLLDRWQKLSEAWGELADKHDHAKAAVSMVQQVVSQRLMGV
jgi:predicted DNA-binding WGR domain protein